MNYSKNILYYVLLAALLASLMLVLIYNICTLNQQEGSANAKQLITKESPLNDNIQANTESVPEGRQVSSDFDKYQFIVNNLDIANAYQQKGFLDTALLLIEEALTYSKIIKNDTLVAEAYHSLGRNYQFSGRLELAIESYHHALKLNNSLKLSQNSVKQLNNIGLLYREEGEYDLALEYLEKCLRISKENGYKKIEYYNYTNIGYILMKQNKWEEALTRFEQTLELSQSLKDTITFCIANYLVADAKLHTKDYTAAKKFAQNALNIANHIDHAFGKVYSRRVLSEVYLYEKKYNKARKTANEALSYIKENYAYIYFEDVLRVLYEIEYETGNYKKALTIQKQLYERRDSLNQARIKEKIANSEDKYQLLDNKRATDVLRLQNKSNQRILILVIMVAFLLFASASLSYFAYRKSKNYSQTLKKAIAERTKELEHSNKHLAKSNEELERFAFIASHDLKTPLRDIISFTGLLEKKLKSHDNKKVHKYLSFIKKGGIRMNNLIIDTLEYSRLSYSEKENQIQRVDLNHLLNDLQTSMSYYIQERNAEIIKLNELPHIKANYSSITLLFQNLLENSIKYNQSQTPTIKIYTKDNAGCVSIFLEDNGIGIPKKYHDEIFVMFSRLHTHSEYEGSGLGLPICKKIVEQLNGSIYIQSEANKGSIFEIRLPDNLFLANKLK